MNEETTLTSADFKRLFYRYRRSIIKGSILLAVFVFFFLLLREPRYIAQSSFKQSQGKIEQNFDLKSLLQIAAMGDQESSVVSLMLSQNVLRRTVEELGWQITVGSEGAIRKNWKKISDNFLSELGFSMEKTSPFIFEKVRFEGESNRSASLRFLTPEAFEILDENQSRLALGEIGQAVNVGDLSFTLRSTPDKLALGNIYPLLVKPWQIVVSNVKARFSIKPTAIDKNMLALQFAHRSRFEAARFLNVIVQTYQNFLKEENQAALDLQLAYLDKRKEELYHTFEQTLEAHVSQLKKTLGATGFVDLEQEVETVSKPREDYLQKLFDVEFELGRLQNIHHSKKQEATAQDFQGIDSQTARSLYIQYNRELDTLEVALKQLLFLQTQMSDPTLEISSLGTILTDPVTQEMVRAASSLEIELHDEANRSDKEHIRLRETLSSKRRFIASHLSQLIDLHHLRISLMKEKLSSLEHILVDLLNNEKKLIEERLAEMSNRMSDWPEKWSLEKKFKLSTELTKGMMEGLSQVFETKNLTRHLYRAESRPIDKAIPPISPKPLHLLYFTLSSMLVGAFFIYLFFFFRALLRGFPLSLSTIRSMGEHVCGEISSSAEMPFTQIGSEDLETFRKIAAFLIEKQEKLCVGLLGMKIDFSSSLAQLMHMHRKKPLVISADFEKVVPKEDVPGLWQYLQGSLDTPPIRRMEAFDFVTAGGTTRFSQELLQEGKFAQLIASLREEYDFIFLIGSESLLPFLDAAVVTLDDETMENLENVRVWSRQKNTPRATFIQLEITEVS